MKKMLTFFLALLMITGWTTAQETPEKKIEPGGPTVPAETQIEGTDYEKVVKDPFTFWWKTDDDGYLHVKLIAPTTGWVSVGFNPEKMMKSANFIMGYVKDGQVYMSDEYGTGNTTHKPDTELGGKDNIEDKQGWEKDGTTTISFKIPLNSGDEYDGVLEKGKTYKVLFAYGKKDDFKSYHQKKASIEIKSL